ncbi:hypothetical protein VQE80_15245, partial [Staphylococcus shinii]|uniref:hypothetical protein n=1 Tax=Staphylococcus shinii TaxID=2912228 RepID=UPI003F472C03
MSRPIVPSADDTAAAARLRLVTTSLFRRVGGRRPIAYAPDSDQDAVRFLLPLLPPTSFRTTMTHTSLQAITWAT